MPTVVMRDIFAECTKKVLFVEHDEMSQAAFADTAQKSFNEGVHITRPYGCLDYANGSTLGCAIEVCAERVISITNNESRTLTEWRDIAQLRSRHMHDFASARIHDEESEDWTNPDVVALQKVARADLSCVILDERRLFLAGRFGMTFQGLVNRPLLDVNSELPNSSLPSPKEREPFCDASVQ